MVEPWPLPSRRTRSWLANLVESRGVCLSANPRASLLCRLWVQKLLSLRCRWCWSLVLLLLGLGVLSLPTRCVLFLDTFRHPPPSVSAITFIFDSKILCYRGLSLAIYTVLKWLLFFNFFLLTRISVLSSWDLHLAIITPGYLEACDSLLSALSTLMSNFRLSLISPITLLVTFSFADSGTFLNTMFRWIACVPATSAYALAPGSRKWS